MHGDIGRYQMDYIMVKQRYRNSVTKSCAFSEAEANTDQNLVCMKVNLRLKKIQAGKKLMKWNREQLKGEHGKSFSNDIERELSKIEINTNNVNERWNEMKTISKKSAKKNIGHNKIKKPKKPWVNTEMLDKMDEKKKWKNANTIEGKKKYKKLNNELRRETEKARKQWWDRQCIELEEIYKKR